MAAVAAYQVSLQTWHLESIWYCGQWSLTGDPAVTVSPGPGLQQFLRHQTEVPPFNYFIFLFCLLFVLLSCMQGFHSLNFCLRIAIVWHILDTWPCQAQWCHCSVIQIFCTDQLHNLLPLYLHCSTVLPSITRQNKSYLEMVKTPFMETGLVDK